MLYISFIQLVSFAVAETISGLSLSNPLNDSFYSAPPNLGCMRNGEVYNNRTVTSNIELGIEYARVEQLAYKTTNTQNECSYSIVTVYTPFNISSDPKILSYQVYEDSANLNCAPSYSLAKGSEAPDGSSVSGVTTISIDQALSKGWYAVVPDHEGARSAFIAGHEQAHAGLDGIKAAIFHLGLPIDTPTALLGYSGGASATVWMASLQEWYAPELNIVGAAHGGTPVDLTSTLQHLDTANNTYSGLVVSAIAGLLNAYPGLYAAAWPHFYKTLQDAVTTVWEPSFCMIDALAEFMNTDWQDMSDVDFYTFLPIVEVLDNESLLKNVSSSPIPVPSFPRYIWQADADEVIPAGPVVQYVTEQCEQGADIQYVSWSENSHVIVEYLGLPDALQFIIQAFEQITPKVTCGTANDNILTIESAELGDILGEVVADAFYAFTNTTSPLGDIKLANTNRYWP